MLDHLNQSESLNKLHYDPLTEGLSGLDMSGSTGLGNQHNHSSSRFVIPGIVPKESPFFAALQVKTADLDLKNIFQGDRHVQVQSGKEHSNQRPSFHQDRLTGKMADAQLVGNLKSQSQVRSIDDLVGNHLYPRPQGLSGAHPIVGIIDTGFNIKDSQMTHTSLQLGRDRIDGDDNPLVKAGNQHGTGVLNVIAAKDGNAPLWLGRAVGSGKWSDSLVEFVDSAKTSGRSHAVANLSFDLTQVNADGSVTTRQQLTSKEIGALNYARQNGVLVVAAAGNTGNKMSALGQASQEFDNIITVGAANGLDRANYSSYGNGLTLLAPGSFQKNGKVNEEGTSIATAEVTGAVSQVWAANSKLGYRQVIDILKATATDLNAPGQDTETGAGLLNQTKATHLAALTIPVLNTPLATASPIFTSQKFDYTALERSASWYNPIDLVKSGWDGIKSSSSWLYHHTTDNLLINTFEREIDHLKKLPSGFKQLGGDYKGFLTALGKGDFKGATASMGRILADYADLSGAPTAVNTLTDWLKPTTRSLNNDELMKAKSVFGDSINYSLVRIDQGSLLVGGRKLITGGDDAPMTLLNTINAWGTIPPASLIHELTHVWQYQHTGSIYAPASVVSQITEGRDGAYDYKGVTGLQDHKKAGQGLTSFNVEQQAEIVEDYYRMKNGMGGGHLGSATLQDLPLYAGFVKEVSTLPEKTLGGNDTGALPWIRKGVLPALRSIF